MCSRIRQNTNPYIICSRIRQNTNPKNTNTYIMCSKFSHPWEQLRVGVGSPISVMTLVVALSLSFPNRGMLEICNLQLPRSPLRALKRLFNQNTQRCTTVSHHGSHNELHHFPEGGAVLSWVLHSQYTCYNRVNARWWK
jgi:hypothetical protein